MSDEDTEGINLPFKIEDNIIKGVHKELDFKSIGEISEICLKIFDNYSDIIGQFDVDTGREITYGEMKKNIIRCALWMQKKGIGPGDVVVICTHNQMDDYIPCIATFLVGAIYNPWYHEIPLRLASYLMDLVRPKLVFACEKAVFNLQIAACVEEIEPMFVVFGSYLETESLVDILSEQSFNEVENYHPQAVADDLNNIGLLMFSSGTTGMPKGVALPYKLIYSMLSQVSVFTINTVKFLWYSSLYWISGTICMLQCLKNGSTRIIHTNSDPHEICKVVEQYQINFLFLSPTTATQLAKSNIPRDYDTRALKLIVTGGAKLSSEIIIDIRKNFPYTLLTQGYGMTEMGEPCIVQTLQCKIIDSVGFVVPNVQIKIINIDDGEALGPNEEGELLIKSPLMMIGYYRNKAATEEAIDEEGWLHTGDKAYYSEEGEVVIVDRLKEVMKFRGHHVSPTEIEQVLLRHPAVIEVAVVPIPHELDIEQPIAFVKKLPNSRVTEEELVEMSSELGEMKKLWGGVRFLDEMPHTASGKISRKDLKIMAREIANESNRVKA